MDGIYGLNTRLTTLPGYGDNWAYTMIYYASWFSGGINGSIYNCYLFGNSLYTVSAAKFQSFQGFSDVYTSFLFNLLADSL
jgi:hypothetical protein